MKENLKKWFRLDLGPKPAQQTQSSCCGGGCGGHDKQKDEQKIPDGFEQVFEVPMNRRNALRKLTAGLVIGAGAANSACSVSKSDEAKEKANIDHNFIKFII